PPSADRVVARGGAAAPPPTAQCQIRKRSRRAPPRRTTQPIASRRTSAALHRTAHSITPERQVEGSKIGALLQVAFLGVVDTELAACAAQIRNVYPKGCPRNPIATRGIHVLAFQTELYHSASQRSDCER